jgi:RNA polymerase sigma factor (sigma-70 family)
MDVKNLLDLIISAKGGDENAMLKILDMFKPIIGKYTRMMNYDEDFKSEIITKLISFVKLDFNPDKLREANDFVILKYIENVIYHEYILLSKKNNRKTNAEITYDQDTLVDLSDSIESLIDTLHNSLLLYDIERTLTEREFLCVNLIVLQRYTAEQVAAKLGVTKQAVNQCKNRAIEKLYRFFA